MQQSLTPSASAVNAHSHENEALTELEKLLGERHPAPSSIPESENASVLRRIFPLVLLAGVGAPLALMPGSVKDALITGRSVAHSPGR